MAGASTATSGVHAVVGLTGLTVESGGFTVQHEQVLRIPVPSGVDRAHFSTIQRDFELLAQVAGEYPDDFARLHNAAVESDFRTAARIAGEIGLTEDRFVRDGGGIWGAMITIAAIGIAYVVLTGGSTDTVPAPPQPPPPETDPIPSDVGAPGGAP